MAAVSISKRKKGADGVAWEIRWRQEGRHRSKTFSSRVDAENYLERKKLELELPDLIKQEKVYRHAVQAIEKIAKAGNTGRPIIFLVGAGISTDSSVPSKSSLARYAWALKAHLSSQTRGRGFIDDFSTHARHFLSLNGWPDVSNGLHKCRKPTRQETAHSSWSVQEKWRDLVRELILDDQTLMMKGADATAECLFASLVQKITEESRPTIAHRYLAFLLRLSVSERIVFTTCFDNLIESALVDESISYRVNNISEFGYLQSPSDDTSKVTVIKLHGTTCAEQALGTIDIHPNEKQSAKFREYIPQNALLIILGYSGSDSRVSGFIESYLDSVECYGNELDAVWLFHSKPPVEHHSLWKRQNLKFAPTSDAGLFLQDLYLELDHEFPASSVPYRCLPNTRPEVFCRKSQNDIVEFEFHDTKIKQNLPSVHVFYSKDPHRGTSAALSGFVRSIERGFDHSLWIDLEDIPTLDTLIARIFDLLSPFDNRLRVVSSSTGAMKDEIFLARAAKRISESIARSHTILSLTAIQEFAPTSFDHFVEDDLSQELLSEIAEDRSRHRDRLWKFLKLLTSSCEDSKRGLLFLSHGGESDELYCLLKNNSICQVVVGGQDFAQQDFTVHPGSISERMNESRPAITRFNWDSLQTLFQETYQPSKDELTTDSNEQKTLQNIWRLLKDDYKTILAMASAVRLPRTTILMRNVIAHIWGQRHHVIAYKSFLESIHDDTKGPGHLMSEPALVCPEIDRRLKKLCETGLLVRQEGGSLRMFRSVRKFVSDRFSQDVEEMFGDTARISTLSNLHNAFACEYFDRHFKQSHDLAIFFEYVNHRLLSCLHPDTEILEQRLSLLLTAFEDASEDLLARGYEHQLVDWFRCLRRYWLKHFSSSQSECGGRLSMTIKNVCRMTCELEATVRREAMDLDGTIRLRMRQLFHRLEESDLRKEWEALEFSLWPRNIFALSLDDNETCFDNIIDEVVRDPNKCMDSTDSITSTIKFICQKLKKLESNEKNVSRQKIDSLLRALNHILDIAVCYKGTRRYHQSNSILYDLENELKSLLDVIQHSTDVRLEHEFFSLAIRVYYRIADLALEQIRPWKYSVETLPVRLSDAKCHVAKGEEYLREYISQCVISSGRTDRSAWVDLYQSYFLTFSARISYLEAVHCFEETPPTSNQCEKLFEKSRSLFDQSLVEIHNQVGGSAAVAKAVTRLFRAEMLILRSDFYFRNQIDSQDIGDETNLDNSGSESLTLANKDLEDAEELLELGRRNLWWWTSLHGLKAQLIHENVLNLIAKWSTIATKRNDQLAWHRNINMLITQGIERLEAAMDTGCGDSVRVRHLEVMYWQMYTCFAAAEMLISGNINQHDLAETWSEIVNRIQAKRCDTIDVATNYVSEALKQFPSDHSFQQLRLDLLSAESSVCRAVEKSVAHRQPENPAALTKT